MTRIPALVAAALAVALVAPAAAAAQAPANDDRAAATLISGLPVTVTGSNAGATAEPGEPDRAGSPARASVWFRWTAPASGAVSADTCGSSFDTVLAVYTVGPAGDLREVASSDDSCELQSIVSFTAAAGQEYLLAVDGFDGATGTFTLRLAGGPPTDPFAGAGLLQGFPALTQSNNVNATAEPGEPGGAEHSVWYRWRAPVTAAATAQTCGSSFDTVLDVFEGDQLSELRLLGSNDDGCRLGSRVGFRAVAGREYRLRVDGFEGATGDFVLLVRGGHPPRNDLFGDAQTLRGTRARVRGRNIEAGREQGEPRHDERLASASVWYRWTAPRDGRATVSTCRYAGFDTVLAVYTGNRLGGLREVASSDDDCRLRSRVTFAATRGTAYRIAVDGFGGAQGRFELRLTQR